VKTQTWIAVSVYLFGFGELACGKHAKEAGAGASLDQALQVFTLMLFQKATFLQVLHPTSSPLSRTMITN
jgi:hypothetical protein